MNTAYSINGYDKDNDVYACYGQCLDIDVAINKAKKLAKQTENGQLMRKCSDGTEEPIDWIEVWNENNGDTVWASYTI